MLDSLFSGSSFTLLWPLALLMLPLPFFIKPVSSERQNLGLAVHTPMFEAVKSLGISHHAADDKVPRWVKFFLVLSWLSLVFASARPTYMGEKVDLPQSGRDLMLAIDISPSMKEKDLHLADNPVTRLTVVKKVVSEFIEQRQGDRLGLILFGSEPYIQSPLSFDLKTLNTLLSEAYIGMAGQATAIGDAIGLGVKRLKERPQDSRVLILLSDGANTAGDIPPEKAADLAALHKIKVYTIGIGADEMYKRSFFGSQIVNPSSDLDEEMLTLIADKTEGRYFRARKTEDLEKIYALINELEEIELDKKSYRPQKSLVHIFMIASLISWLTYLLLKKYQHTIERLSSTMPSAIKRQFDGRK